MQNGATTTIASSLQVEGINTIEFTEEEESGSGGLERLRVRVDSGSINSAGELQIISGMSESEFKEKFLCYFAVENSNSPTYAPMPYGDKQKYIYYNSSNNEFTASNTNFEAFRFDSTSAYISIYPNGVPEQNIRLSIITLFKS